MNTQTLDMLFYISPVIILIFTSVFVLLLDAFLAQQDKKLLLGISLLGLVVAAASSLLLWNTESAILFNGTVKIDRFSIFFNMLFITLTSCTLLMNHTQTSNNKQLPGEFFFFILAACSAMMLMSWSYDLITFFISLEIMSLSVYVLTGMNKSKIASAEGALKYFILGAFSTGFILFGIAFIYAACGSIQFSAISHYLMTAQHVLPTILYLGSGLLLVGFSFKIGAVPFHMWIPDAYQGAPTVVTAFMATAVKAAGIAVLIRFFLVALLPIHEAFSGILVTLTILTMTVGNLAALLQTNMKRMLAYSSIAHAGYILIAVCCASSQNFNLSATAILFYLVAYGFMTLGSFLLVQHLGKNDKEDLIKNYAGLGFKKPLIAVSMALFMLSLTGIPLTAGFIGKFYIFSAALKAGFLSLAIIGILNSVIAAYYYLRVIVIMYMQKESEEVILNPNPAIYTVLAVTVFATLFFGIFPSSLLKIIFQSVTSIL